MRYTPRMRRALSLCAMLALADRAHAGPSVDDPEGIGALARHADAGAWLVARISPSELAQLEALAALGGVSLPPDLDLVPAEAAEDLALLWNDGTQRDGFLYNKSGLLALSEHEADDGAPAHTVTRSVFPVANAGDAQVSLADLFGMPLLSRATRAELKQLAQDLGEPAKRAKKLATELRGAGVFVAGRRGSGWLFAWSLGDVVIVDRVDRNANGREDRNADGRADASDKATPWRADRAITSSSETGFDIARAGAELLLATGADVWLDPARRAGGGVCAPFRELSDRGPFSSASVRLELRSRVTIQIAWKRDPDVDLRAALARADDGLPWREGKAFTAKLYIAGTRALRKLARTMPLAKDWLDLRKAIRTCGTEAQLWVALFGWPQATALFLDEIAALDASADDAVSGIRNMLVSFDTLSLDAGRLEGIAEASFDATAATAVSHYLDLAFGRARKVRKPRPHTRWGGGTIRPYRLRRDPDAWVIGAAFGPAKLDGRLVRKIVATAETWPLVRFSVNVARAIDDLSGGHAGALIAGRFGGTLEGSVWFLRDDLFARIVTK